MQSVMEKITLLTQELLKKACDVKYGKVSANLDIQNGRIVSIISTTAISVKDYLDEEIKLPSTTLVLDQKETKNEQ